VIAYRAQLPKQVEWVRSACIGSIMVTFAFAFVVSCCGAKPFERSTFPRRLELLIEPSLLFGELARHILHELPREVAQHLVFGAPHDEWAHEGVEPGQNPASSSMLRIRCRCTACSANDSRDGGIEHGLRPQQPGQQQLEESPHVSW
jgi:hypothetical protein